MTKDPLRAQLIRFLEADDAHMRFEEAVADFPDDAINQRPPNVGYTPWHLVEHLRITQWDILEYVRNPAWVSPEWPIGYWPDPSATATPDEFAGSVARFLADRAALRDLVADPAWDLTTPIPHTPGHTLLREVVIVADHNAYHVGELAILRQVMGTWPGDRAGKLSTSAWLERLPAWRHEPDLRSASEHVDQDGPSSWPNRPTSGQKSQDSALLRRIPVDTLRC